MIETGETAVADKDRDNASASKEDDDAQETCGNDEEAGPNDEGDSNDASNTVHDNKVVASGDNGGIIRVREDDSDADNNSAGSRDEEAAGNDDNDGDGKIPASLGILPIPKNCRDSVIITGDTAITEKDRNNARANDRDDNAVGQIDDKQGTCGGDEEARTNDEGDGNVARETDRDDKVVVLGEGGDDTRTRDDNDNSSSDKDVSLKKTSDNSSSSLSDDSSSSSSTGMSSTKANNIEMDALAVRQGKASNAREESSKESSSSLLSTRQKSLTRKMAARELSLTNKRVNAASTLKIATRTSTSGNVGLLKVSTNTPKTTTAERGKKLCKKRPVETSTSGATSVMSSIDTKKRATTIQDHVGEKIARATTATNATENATTEKKTTTAETEAILAKKRPVERSTSGVSKAAKKRRTAKKDPVLHNEKTAKTISNDIPKALEMAWNSMEVSRRKVSPEIGVTNQPGQKKTPVKVG